MKKTILLVFLLISPSVFALTFSNLDFESGSGDGNIVMTGGAGTGGSSALTSWNQYANSDPSTKTEQSLDQSVSGVYSARIEGNANNGIYQYGLSSVSGSYTLSAWVYVLSGNAGIALFQNGGSDGVWSSDSASLNTWEYLSITRTFDGLSNLKGPVLYTRSANSEFYIDGVWFNEGSTSTSPFRPESGFDPNRVPDTGSTALILCVALLGLAAGRLKGLHRTAHRL